MKFLSNYFDFIFEAVDKKEMRLYYSPEFREILEKISKKIPWVKILLLAEDSNQISDIYTLIDVTDKNDTISFIQVNRILRAEPDTKTYPDSDIYFLNRNITNDKNNDFWKKGRTDIGIGRWLRRVIFDLYKSSIEDRKIEEFVNLYKSTFDGDESNFEVVKGEDIKKWYFENSYDLIRGQLGNSCMRYYKCQEYFDIYTKNPEVCSLLILKSEQDKICGRALLWNLKDGTKYQDRIYTIHDSDRELFNEWADKNGYSTYQNLIKTIEVQLGDNEYSKYPYMDTFVTYNYKSKVLSSDESLWPDKGYYLLQDTNGGYKADNVVYSDWYDEYINPESAVYCRNVDTYLYERDAIWLEYKGEWAAQNDDLVYSEYHGMSFYIDDVDYSDCIEDYLLPSDKNVITIITSESGDTDLCLKSREEFYIKVDDDYYLRKNCIKDPYTGEWKFKSSKYDKELDIKLMAIICCLYFIL